MHVALLKPIERMVQSEDDNIPASISAILDKVNRKLEPSVSLIQ
jgi:hypothetical protein